MNWIYLLYLACPIGMGLMMWMMMRNNDQIQTKSPATRKAGDLAGLHQQLQSLESQQASIMAEIQRLREEERPPKAVNNSFEPAQLRPSPQSEARQDVSQYRG